MLRNIVILLMFAASACGGENSAPPMSIHTSNGKFNELTPEEARVILRKGTERPYSGDYLENKQQGTYLCRQCEAPLYRSADKFDSRCGWPSFDDEIDGAVLRVPDPDGRRTEIICSYCNGHLGHVFLGEGFTEKNTRHCVNSVSMKFVPEVVEPKTAAAVFGSGCFWGTEYFFQRQPGVIKVESGYSGGQVENPTYEQVCTGRTGHAEVVRVIYEPSKTDYESLARLFFETHDPTQLNRQGPDIGTQYRSVIFYHNDDQRRTAEKLIGLLREKDLDVVTEVSPRAPFWRAEAYHQNYYNRTGGVPYCHAYVKRF